MLACTLEATIEPIVASNSGVGKTLNTGAMDFLPQPQHPSRCVLEAGPEAVPIRRGVEDFQIHDPRGYAVSLPAVQEIVDWPQRRRQSGRIDGLSHSHSPVRPSFPLLDASTLISPLKPPASDASNRQKPQSHIRCGGHCISSAQVAEESADVVDQFVGGFHGSEVAAMVDVGPASDGVFMLDE